MVGEKSSASSADSFMQTPAFREESAVRCGDQGDGADLGACRSFDFTFFRGHKGISALPAPPAFSARRTGRWGDILEVTLSNRILPLYMSNPATPDSQQPTETSTDNGASFADLLAQHERGHSHKTDDGSRRLEATVVALTADSVLLDIGYK